MFKTLRKKKAGFTIVEVVVAAVIFAMVATGMIAAVSAMRQPAGGSGREVTAALFGKQILDDLRTEVDASTWGGASNLSIGTHAWPATTIGATTYTANYVVFADPGGSGARQVTLNVYWNE